MMFQMKLLLKHVDFVQNKASHQERNERTNDISASEQNQLINDVRNTLLYPSNRYGGNVANTVYNADENNATVWRPQTDFDNKYYNDDGGRYTQQPYVVMRETKDTFQFSGDKV